MITGESPGTGSRCLALDIVSCYLSLFGVPCPSLYKLKGRVTWLVLVGLGLLYYKWSLSLASFVREYSLYFLLSRHIITWAGRLGLGPCRPSEAPAGSPMSLQARESSHQWAAIHVSRQSSGGLTMKRQVRPGHISGRVIPRGISPTLAPRLIWVYPC